MTTIALAPSRLRDLGELLATEYLVPNGLAGYTMGTAAGARTRQYHGFLVAALVPPVVRALLVAQVDIAAQIGADVIPARHASVRQWHGRSRTATGARPPSRSSMDCRSGRTRSARGGR